MPNSSSGGEALRRFLEAACGTCAEDGLSEAARWLKRRPELPREQTAVAAAVGDVDSLRRLLDRDDSEATRRVGPFDWPPLLYTCASRYGTSDGGRAGELARAARLLIDRGADPNAFTLFHKADPTSRLTALFFAGGLRGNAPLTRALLQAGARPNDGESMFHAAQHGHFECLEAMLDHGGDLNDTSHPAGNTVLHWILDWGYNAEAVPWLLEHGADPNLRVGDAGETALHVAIRRNRPGPLDDLLQHGAEIDARTRGGKTAWAHAYRRGFEELAAWLAERGADTTLTPADELAVALRRNELDQARAMIAADPALVPGMHAEEARILPDLAGRELPQAVELLLEAGADVAARGLDGGTALHQAAWFGQPAAVEVLLRHDAPLEVRGDAHDSTPLGWACHGSTYSDGARERAASYARVAELLLAAGARLADPADPDGDPHGRWLLRDAGEQVAEVLRRHGARE